MLAAADRSPGGRRALDRAFGARASTRRDPPRRTSAALLASATSSLSELAIRLAGPITDRRRSAGPAWSRWLAKSVGCLAYVSPLAVASTRSLPAWPLRARLIHSTVVPGYNGHCSTPRPRAACRWPRVTLAILLLSPSTGLPNSRPAGGGCPSPCSKRFPWPMHLLDTGRGAWFGHWFSGVGQRFGTC
jgi:hypothetical protein